MALIAEIPACLSRLQKDRRGYPVPVTAAVDNNGTPHFTITDPVARHKMMKEDRCHISGGKLLRGRWFLGGPMAAFHDHGAFLDGPMLDDASLFAVRTCPYLAAPNYSKRIDGATVPKDGTSGFIALRMHEEVHDDRPTIFVRLMCIGQKTVPSSANDVLFVPKRPFRKVEFWKSGVLLDFHKGVEEAVESSKGELTTQQIMKACGL